MKLKDGIIFILILLFLGGCAVQNSNIEKRGVLDESLYYYELATTRRPGHRDRPARIDVKFDAVQDPRIVIAVPK